MSYTPKPDEDLPHKLVIYKLESPLRSKQNAKIWLNKVFPNWSVILLYFSIIILYVCTILINILCIL